MAALFGHSVQFELDPAGQNSRVAAGEDYAAGFREWNIFPNTFANGRHGTQDFAEGLKFSIEKRAF
jgi:hypothetical protein